MPLGGNYMWLNYVQKGLLLKNTLLVGVFLLEHVRITGA